MLSRREFLGYLALQMGMTVLSYVNRESIMPSGNKKSPSEKISPEFEGTKDRDWLNSPHLVCNYSGISWSV